VQCSTIPHVWDHNDCSGGAAKCAGPGSGGMVVQGPYQAYPNRTAAHCREMQKAPIRLLFRSILLVRIVPQAFHDPSLHPRSARAATRHCQPHTDFAEPRILRGELRANARKSRGPSTVRLSRTRLFKVICVRQFAVLTLAVTWSRFASVFT
jgi:hypothetical protein